MTDLNTLSPQERRDRLAAIIRARSFSDEKEFTLASGRKSWLYFNMKPTMMDPEGAYLIAEAIVDKIQGSTVDYVGGLEMGAVPLVSCVAPASYRRVPGAPVRAFFVRKAVKAHGTQQRVEGLLAGESLAGKRVVMLEDVTTTGGSVLDAIDLVREAGAEVVKVITLVDRQEGAAEALAQAGLEIDPLFTADEFSNK